MPFAFRTMQPADSAAVARLITEFDGDLTTRFLVDAYAAIACGTEFETVGVVVEAAGTDGLIGMGTLRLGRAQFNGEVLPLAFLDGLKVQKAFRGQGLGYQLAKWRVEHARQTLGERCVIATGMLHDNHASHAVAKKWCREFLESGIHALILPTRSRPPRAAAGIRVQDLASRDFEAFAAGQNRFYQGYNLYPPASAESIARALAISVEGRSPYRFFAALDPSGNLLAGAQAWARGLLKADTVNNPPPPLRLLNRLLPLLPPDFVIREVAVSGLWYAPGQARAAAHLWETIRWECRQQGNSLALSLDPRDPVRQLIRLRPWHQPRPKITIAVHGPAPIDRSKQVFATGRV
jgi:predicted N-acetyltransferase YhbS